MKHLLYRYVQLGSACALLGSCGVLGRDTSTSWKCMTEGGKETCDGDRGPKGEKGDTGPQGRQGDKGVPGTVGPAGSSGPSGPMGSHGEPGAQGQNGQQGTGGSPGAQGPAGSAGATGPAGNDGSSCSVNPVVGGALITCADGTSVVLWNGTNGADGQDGADAPPTAYTVVGLGDPCGKQSSFDEVLLRLQNGDLLAHYASGNQQFLAKITPGSYVTTDGTHCYFTVSNDGSITNEHN